MPRPGPKTYECVKRAWHAQIFRVVNEIHGTETKKNKQGQEKLLVVVLKAEEIIYSKANSEHGKMISRKDLEKKLAKEKTEEVEVNSFVYEAMARVVDIGENEDKSEDSEVEGEDEAYEKLSRNWSVLKSTPKLQKSKMSDISRCFHVQISRADLRKFYSDLSGWSSGNSEEKNSIVGNVVKLIK
ncbi:hypothetical protein IFM89_038666 [Coptis chinensis]|uniref:Uncharacterized protein n=1 Tax=Coptis chinensis TaxID=261450 RepID=A0A835I8E1_9MAGN|nr:hypothetical protein IFM89_038666 [Coptis chinensis]